MLRHLPATTLCVSLALTLAATRSPAQVVTWGPVQQSTSATDVSLNGTPVAAHNLHGSNTSGPVNPTVNGVPVTGGFRPSGWDGWVTTGLSGSTTGDAGYDDLLSGTRACVAGSTGNPTIWGGFRLDDLATLTPGVLYEIQCWFTDQRTGTPTNVLHDRVMTLSSVWGNVAATNGEVTNLGSLLQGPLSGPLEADPDNSPAQGGTDTVFGSHCTGSFIYVPGGETWLIIQGSHPVAASVLRPHLTAFQIRDLSGASFSVSGSGCPNSQGQAGLTAATPPVIGQPFQVSLTGTAPASIPLLILGFSDTSWSGTPLPFPLRTLFPQSGAACNLLVGVNLLFPGASVTLPVPNSTTLVGGTFFVQGGEFEGAALSVTAKGTAVIGR